MTATLIRANAIRAQRLRFYARLTGLPCIPPPMEELEPIEVELWSMLYDLDEKTRYLDDVRRRP